MRTNISSLERDIANNAVERLDRWFKDTAMRCQTARVPVKTFEAIAGAALIALLVSLGTQGKSDYRRTMGKVIKKICKAARKKHQRKKRHG